MQNKTAIVTGGGRGIGRAISIALGASGYHVIINYKSNESAAKETLEKIREAGGDGDIFAFDVSDSIATQKAMTEITKQFEIEALVNNAGITADGLFIMMPEKDWHSVVDTALNGFYNVTKPVLKQMLRKKRGSVVSIASVAGLIGNRGQANYSAAKAGIIAASKSVSSEVARLGIRVNVVAPGLIQTEMIKDAPVEMIKKIIPMARIGKPEEVAAVVKFLCSEEASYITGQVISVNGGMI
ncbi:MAG: 3-oxoacyl-ACP reductase FabG [Desulfobacterales bacterium CG23_combo_of_CG06-09_8_20_14_all_51_8]|nr:MAG: 3-oxoacyl-ACP reductase FabG [Desulfobacterales bacterium CG23_combo_of_CG06-09_8_20_14_all_51_8]